MAHKKKSYRPGPLPPQNRPRGAPNAEGESNAPAGATANEPSNQEQDPKRRIGGFSGAGEHPRQQPSAINDGQTHHQ